VLLGVLQAVKNLQCCSSPWQGINKQGANCHYIKATVCSWIIHDCVSSLISQKEWVLWSCQPLCCVNIKFQVLWLRLKVWPNIAMHTVRDQDSNVFTRNGVQGPRSMRRSAHTRGPIEEFFLSDCLFIWLPEANLHSSETTQILGSQHHLQLCHTQSLTSRQKSFLIGSLKYDLYIEPLEHHFWWKHMLAWQCFNLGQITWVSSYLAKVKAFSWCLLHSTTLDNSIKHTLFQNDLFMRML
jgi:hypothetical protein